MQKSLVCRCPRTGHAVSSIMFGTKTHFFMIWLCTIYNSHVVKVLLFMSKLYTLIS
uniref:Uncharacterized protein n=1 Tax=Anguilla anguilla TaxID=7936 RepID=A0A0E9VF14_ANGAN